MWSFAAAHAEGRSLRSLWSPCSKTFFTSGAAFQPRGCPACCRPGRSRVGTCWPRYGRSARGVLTQARPAEPGAPTGEPTADGKIGTV